MGVGAKTFDVKMTAPKTAAKAILREEIKPNANPEERDSS